jgi:hypothetical protein
VETFQLMIVLDVEATFEQVVLHFHFEENLDQHQLGCQLTVKTTILVS